MTKAMTLHTTYLLTFSGCRQHDTQCSYTLQHPDVKHESQIYLRVSDTLVSQHPPATTWSRVQM